MTLASDAMKGLNKAETAVNSSEKPANPAPKSSEKPATSAQKSSEKPAQTDKQVKLSSEQAKAVSEMVALKNFIEKNKLGVDDGKKTYVKAEVYQYIAQQKGLLPTFLTEEGYRDDKTYFCRTTCILRTIEGVEISRSTMIADKKEDFLKPLDDFAVMGLSETRAMARAVKNIYGYLLTAIGYQATPLEEINDKKGQ